MFTLLARTFLSQPDDCMILLKYHLYVSEFDKFLEEHKDRLESLETKDDITDAELSAQEIEIDEADQEVGC